MFPSSSQRQYWTFRNEDEIKALRQKHNQKFQQYHGDRIELNVIQLKFLKYSNYIPKYIKIIYFLIGRTANIIFSIS